MALCRICKEKKIITKADVYLKHYRLPLCRKHFKEWFLKRLKGTIEKFDMFKESVAVGVSGGMDSMTLWQALTELGYKVYGIHINLGIPGASEKAYEKVSKFAEEKGLDLHVINLKDEVGATLPEIVKLRRRPACAVCGQIKRALLNKYAKKFNVEAVATGHHLDDEAATLLANILTWNLPLLKRKLPVLPSRDGFVKKVKPLVRFTKADIKAWVDLEGIDYVKGECPLSTGASLKKWTALLEEIEKAFPQTKFKFLFQYWEIIQPIFREHLEIPEDEFKIVPCKYCGEPAVIYNEDDEPICTICKLRELVNQSLKIPSN